MSRAAAAWPAAHRWLATLALLLTGGSTVLAAPPAKTRRLTLEVPEASSRLTLSGDERDVFWVTTEEEASFLYTASLRTGRARRLRELPELISPGSELLLLPVPGARSRLLVAAKCCMETNPWFLWLIRLDDGEDITLGGAESETDGRLLLSPSGRYVAVGTGFDCVGGGFDCMADAITIFSTRSGDAECLIPTGERRTIPGSSGTSRSRVPSTPCRRRETPWPSSGARTW